MAARLCSRCFYWKYQDEGQGRPVFVFQPGLEGGGGASRLRGWDNRQCSGQRSSFHGGRPSCEGLRLAVEVGSVWGVRCVPWGLPPTLASLFPASLCPISPAACGEGSASSEEEEVGQQVKSEEGGRVSCRPQERLKDGEETWQEGAPLHTCTCIPSELTCGSSLVLWDQPWARRQVTWILVLTRGGSGQVSEPLWASTGFSMRLGLDQQPLAG